MLVNILADPGLFRDLLEQSLLSSGSDIGHITDDPGVLMTAPHLTGCLVAHIRDSGGQTCAALDHLHARQPDLPIVLVCAKELECALVKRMGGLVNGIISDDRPLELVLNAINVAGQGFTILDRNANVAPPATLPSQAVHENSISHTPHISEPLTNREQAILEKLRDGQSNKEIARAFNISDSTVKAHTRSIFRKIGVRNRTQAAMWVPDDADLTPT